MKATAPVLVLAAALLAAACGEGRAIFNVDIQSFIAGTGNDTIPYVIPPGTATASNWQKIDLPPGFGSSIVESATITGAGNLINTGGTGSIGFQLYLAADSAGTLQPGALALDIPEASVTGAGTFPITISGGLTPAVLSVLNQSQVWIRLVAKGTNPNVTPVTGNMGINALTLRVVFQDKIF
ncbi:MAG TPA: hypothetical protein VGQ25_02620 [Gemmatimonadales bacterium]|jgi:hypothetical protein|nr:hypothetical protein [Gemmatimonadales bacterium]